MQQRCLSVENTKVPYCRGVVLPSTQKILFFFCCHHFILGESPVRDLSLVCYPPVIIGILIFWVILGTGPVISSDFKCTFFCQLILDHLAIIGRCLGFGPCMSKMRELQDPHSPLFFPHDCADYERGCLHGFSSAFSAVSCCNFKVSLLVWARISQLYQCT